MSRSARYTYRPGTLPLSIRVYNAGRRVLDRAGVGRRDFDESALVAAAERRTGLHDFGDPEFREPLRMLIDCFERDAGLSPYGRALMRGALVEALAKRLRLEEAFRRDPSILDERIERPVFIVGLPRTGSTHLHHLLCSDPAVRAPLYWQLLWPTPPPDERDRHRDPRIRAARRRIRRGSRMIPALPVLHTHSEHAPEECQFLFDASMMNPLLPAGERWVRWWRTRDMVPAYRYYRRQLQLLQHRWHGRHWVLKAPFHLWHLDALLQVFPDARFVVTHRHPADVVPSACSYAAIRMLTFRDGFDPEELGSSIRDWLGELSEQLVDRRPTIESSAFVDVAFEELTSAPMATVERIYDTLGEPLTPDARRAMRRYLAAHPRHRHGVHRYSFEQFGLRREDVQGRFERYLAMCEAHGIGLA